MIIRAKTLREGPLACLLAAVVSERDVLRGGRSNRDLRARMAALLKEEDASADIDPNAVRRVREVARQVARAAGVTGRADSISATGLLVALAWPDRVAQRRGEQYRLAQGRGAALPADDSLATEDWLALADVDAGTGPRAKIWLAAPITPAEIEAAFPDEITEGAFVVWDRPTEQVVARHQRRFRALVLEDRALADAGGADAVGAVCDGIRQIGLHALPWTPETESFRARIRFLREVEGAGRRMAGCVR